MKTPRLALLSFLWLIAACGKGGDAADVAAPPPKPSEPGPFTFTYVYREKPDADALATVIVTSDGVLSVSEDKPAKHFKAQLDPDKTKRLAELVADPDLRKLTSSDPKAAGPIVEVELLDAKGALWRLRVAGDSPPPMKPVRAFVDGLQTALGKPERPPAVSSLELQRLAAGAAKDAPPKEQAKILANTLMMVRADGKPSHYGNVASDALDTLRVGAAALELVKSTPPAAGAGEARVLHFERDDAPAVERRFEGGIPLAAEVFLARVDKMREGVKALAPFTQVTFQSQAMTPKKGPVEVLTVDALGKLALTSDDKPVATGDAAEDDLFAVYSTLAAVDKVEAAAVVAPGPGETVRILKVTTDKGTRELKFGDEAPSGMGRLMKNLADLKATLAPKPADAPK